MHHFDLIFDECLNMSLILIHSFIFIAFLYLFIAYFDQYLNFVYFN